MHVGCSGEVDMLTETRQKILITGCSTRAPGRPGSFASQGRDLALAPAARIG